ncbi:TauD/TfdA family dioxygenase [Mangrovimicrobium sediminis]|uniref:TauD/TfdA family dioxygenase n=1 Tax=Mangrovimicrobium sediminis TaxID=2562682 RepID=A0A4Z0LVC4_9GAMM|nr:TauD/TfdA family dioxygenase [Haliea sp. SAOS-164]TGD71066.1 TauD/TfdA family dioxygenase [Haliea sp. SAOS-164]
MSELSIKPLQDNLTFGVRIGGVTLDNLRDPAVRQQIEDVFVERGMIVFEDIEQSDAMQLELSTVFGPLKEHPVKAVTRVDSERMPGVVEIRTPANSGGVVEVDGMQLSHWLPWHFDHCYTDELNRAGVLRAVKLVEVGGITRFLDGIDMYNNFPPELLAKIEGSDVVYRLETQYETLRFGVPENFRIVRPKPTAPGFQEIADAMPRALHPAVWTRPTGEQVLHVSLYMAQGIAGSEDAEGDALLDEVCKAINELGKTRSYEHKWKPTDMLIWDNLRMLHAVSGNRPEDERTMYRTTIKGDYGLGRLEGGADGAAVQGSAY